MLLIAPLVLGMLLAARAPDVAAKIRHRTAQMGAIVLGGVIIYGTIYFFPVLFPMLPLLGAVAAGHNAAAFLLGALAAFLLRASKADGRALTFEVGIQNSGLALVILVGQLKGLGGAAAVAAVWGVWHLIAGGFIVLVLRFFDRKESEL
jgi:BASS family bile acid:Na+ symporter